MTGNTDGQAVTAAASAAVTSLEQQIVNKIGDVWNDFLQLPSEHYDDLFEFRIAIHALQEKVLARSGRRAMLAVGAPVRPVGER